jgi:hypothetical protein
LFVKADGKPQPARSLPWHYWRPEFPPEPPRPAADVNADGKPHQPAPAERSLPELVAELIALMIEQRS